jgi:hypothetical protein
MTQAQSSWAASWAQRPIRSADGNAIEPGARRPYSDLSPCISQPLPNPSVWFASKDDPILNRPVILDRCRSRSPARSRELRKGKSALVRNPDPEGSISGLSDPALVPTYPANEPTAGGRQGRTAGFRLRSGQRMFRARWNSGRPVLVVVTRADASAITWPGCL